MDCRKANIILISIVSTLSIITCLVLIKVLLSGVKGFEWGSVSDWVSSICNVVMASAAVGAYIVARNYFTDIIKKDGYDLIKKLHLILIPEMESNLNLSTGNVLDLEVDLYIAGENGIFQEDDEESNLNISLSQDLSILQKRLKTSYRLAHEISDTINNLDVYGWRMVNKKREQLQHILKTHELVFAYIHNITIYLQEILRRESPNFHPIDKSTYYSVNDKNAPPAYQDIELLVSKLKHYHSLLYSNDNETPYTKILTQFHEYHSDGKHLKKYFEFKP